MFARPKQTKYQTFFFDEMLPGGISRLQEKGGYNRSLSSFTFLRFGHGRLKYLMNLENFMGVQQFKFSAPFQTLIDFLFLDSTIILRTRGESITSIL